MAVKYYGNVDQLSQAFALGWAASSEGQPSSVDVIKNGVLIAHAHPTLTRDDLPGAGFPAESGFAYHFVPPLSAEDTIEICFPDGEPLPGAKRQTHQLRLSQLLTGIDLHRMRGIELGPLDRPIVAKEHSDVLYVDHANRTELVAKYASTPPPAIYLDAIAEVDVIWKGGALADALPAGVRFDYCIAAHVIEHVPDPIGWLAGLSDVLKPGGIISLAIPDRNHSFDYRRDLTGPADLIDAYLRKLTRPGARQVFDCVAFASPFDKAHLHLPTYDKATLQHALTTARLAEETSNYFDMHCSVFTHESFKACWEVISMLDLLPLTLAESFEPRGDALEEFVVILRRT